jgi:hypothetical protein
VLSEDIWAENPRSLIAEYLAQRDFDKFVSDIADVAIEVIFMYIFIYIYIYTSSYIYISIY